jgi:hypothetical protein
MATAAPAPAPAPVPVPASDNLTPAQRADLAESKLTPVERFELLVQEAELRLRNGGGFTPTFVLGLRTTLAHMRGDSHKVVDTATFDGTNWIVTRPGLHAVTLVPTPGMTLEQAILAAKSQLDAFAAEAAGIQATSADTAKLVGTTWTVTRPGLTSVEVPATVDMSVEDAIAAAQPALDKAQADKVAALTAPAHAA